MASDITGNGYYVVTSLMESIQLGSYLGEDAEGVEFSVFLKLENTQPSQSFKLRGISNLMIQEHKNGAKGFVSASGGNAGLAAAFVAKKLNLPLKVFVPGSIKKSTIEKLTTMGADVEIVDGEWQAVDGKARQESEATKRPYVHPFDHPLLWQGHASMILESSVQLRGQRPDVVVVSVGGGGLLMGVAEGMDKVGWGEVPIVAMETEGTSSFNQSLAAGRLITLEKIDGIASSLGATRVSSQLLELSKRRRIISKVVTDAQCVQASAKFLEDHLMLIEPACGATLSAVYSRLIPQMRLEGLIQSGNNGVCNILIIVCGGKIVSSQQLAEWKKEFLVD